MPFDGKDGLSEAERRDETYYSALQALSSHPSAATVTRMFWEVVATIEAMPLTEGEAHQAEEYCSIMRHLLSYLPVIPHRERQTYRRLAMRHTEQGRAIASLVALSRRQPVEAYTRATTLFGARGERLDNLLHDELGEIMCRYLCHNNSAFTSVAVRTVLSDYLSLAVCRPSQVHSAMLSVALSWAQKDTHFAFYTFVDRWGVEHLRAEDFVMCRQKEQWQLSLVERLCQYIASNGGGEDLLRQMCDRPVWGEVAKIYWQRCRR